ncbi:MAG: dNTP triphosphohydrolase [Leeuwenhoekiella sp.]
MMHWEQLLSLKRFGDTAKRPRKEQDDTRLGFEVDYDRIIFSSLFRTLQDKTQVIPLSKTDFVHTRLTHSLEVSVVGRSLGRLAGKQILERHPQLKSDHGYQFGDFGAIVAAAALAHDIGNPPFGHSGEKAIGAYFSEGNGRIFKDSLTAKEFQDLTHFEGNANGFHLLNQHRQGAPGGLRLSYATLGAFTKYPKESLPHRPTKQVADKKYGYFQEDKAMFEEVADELGLNLHNTSEEKRYARHPLAFLVEAADDICYTIIDFEDGINLGLIPEEFALEYLIKLIGKSIKNSVYSTLGTTTDRLAYLRSLAINTLIQEAVSIFMDNEEAILNGSFDKALLDKSSYGAQINDIKSISVEKIYNSPEVIEKEIAGYEILDTLLDIRCSLLKGKHNHYQQLLSRLFNSQFIEWSTMYQQLLKIATETAILTDGNALRLFQKVRGLDVN